MPLAQADPYPPYWQGGSGNAIHFQPVAWPADGAWRPYTSQGVDIADRRDQDQSNGGTSPQGYVNVSSGCTDTSLPSIYYAYAPATQTLFFRWRVQAPPHNYATGPSAGSYAATSPWSSALWTVLIDLNGDGYRDFAVHLDGSSGAPAASIDRLAAIYSTTLTHSLDYLGDPANITLVNHNPTAFVDLASGRVLNFQGSLTPTATWPNGSSETAWDYGTTRATLLPSGCGEYFIDYQIPLAMLDATSVGGPAVTPNTPMALFFTTSNSLTNPLQKDAVTTGAFVAGTGPLPFGDVITPASGTVLQPLVLDSMTLGACSASSTITAGVMDARSSSGSTVSALEFYRYSDLNANGLPDDGQTWTSLGAGAPVSSGSSTFSATWSPTALPSGQYLIGAKATDTAVGGSPANVTWAFYSSSDVVTNAGTSPPNYANPSPTPGVLYKRFVNSCGTQPISISATITPGSTAAGNIVRLVVDVTNNGAAPVSVSQIAVPIPTGFAYNGLCFCTLGTPAVEPVNGATGTLVWGSFPSPVLGPGATGSLDVYLDTSTTPGTYAMTPTAVVDGMTVTSSPVSVELGSAALSLTASTSAPSITPGGAAVNVVARYGNTGPVSASGTVLQVTLPSDFTFQSASDGGTYNAGTRVVTWTIGTLPGLTTGQRTVSVTADAPYGGATPASFPATLTAGGGLSDNASASLAVNTTGSALGVDIHATTPAVSEATSTTLTIHYANSSSSAATGATLTLPIPAGFTYQTSNSGGSYNGGTATVTWALGTLPAGGSGTVTVTVLSASIPAPTDPPTPLPFFNPPTFTATLSATGATSATDAQVVGIIYGAGDNTCTVYYFRNQAVTGIASSLAATIGAPTGSATSIPHTATNASYTHVATFYQDPAAATDFTLAAGSKISTYFYATKTNGPQLFLRATVYDYDPADPNNPVSLGVGNFSDNGSATNQEFFFQVTVTAQRTLAKGHRLMWKFEASSNNNISFTFLYGGATSQGRASYCVTPPASPVIDHDVTPLLGAAGDALVYTTRFGNLGQTNMTGSAITFTLPSGVTLGSATLNGASVTPTPSGGSFVVPATSGGAASGQVSGGASGVLVVNATIDNPFGGGSSSLLATAALASTQTASIEDSALTKLVAPAVVIDITADKTFAGPGEVVTYTAVVTNVGTAPAPALTLDTTLPVQSYYTYVPDSVTEAGAPSTSETYNAGTHVLQVPLASVPAGGSRIVQWQMVVAGSGIGAATHTLNASVSGSATASGGPVEVHTVTTPALDVQITTSGPNSPAEAGDEITVTAVVTSTGGATASGVGFTGPTFTYGTYVPASMTLAGGPGAGPLSDLSDGDRGAFLPGSNAISVTLGDLAPGEVRTITWRIRLDGTLPSGSQVISGTGGVTSSNAGTRSDAYTVTTTATASTQTTLTAPASVSLPVATLGTPASGTQFTVPAGTPIKVGDVISVGGTLVTVLAVNGTTVDVDQAVTATAGSAILPTVPYVATCTNTGTSQASSAQLVFTLPTGTQFVSASTPGTSNGTTVTWALGSLAPGASAVHEVRVLASTPGTLSAQAVCTFSGGTPTPVTAVTAVGAVVLTKRTTTSAPVAGTRGLEATYVITATNQRGTPATGMVITDSLAPGVTFLAPISVTGATPAVAPQVGDRDLEWSGFAVPANGSVEITFKVSLANLAPGTYQNMAAGTSTNSAVQPFDETGSTDEDIVVPGVLGNTAAVQITTTASAATITLGDIDDDNDPTVVETITVVVTNAATGEQETITLTETGPATGVFSGPLPLTAASGPGTSNDGGMLALGGQTLTVQHVDPLTALGQPLTVSDQAVVPGTSAPPTLTMAATPVTFREGDAPVAVDATLVITPGTSPTLASATIGICSGFVAGQDVLAFTPMHGITGSFSSVSGTLTLTGVATVAQWQAVLRTVTYANTATPVTDANRGICMQVSDGQLTSQIATRTIDVDPNVATARRYYLTEGVSTTFLRTSIFVANPNAQEAPVQIDLYSGAGERATTTLTVPAMTRRVFSLADLATGFTHASVSTVVTSLDGLPLLVEREVEWGDRGYGATAEQAATSLSTRLYFAEGAKAPFSPYLLVLNPGASDAQLTVRFLNADGSSADSIALVARAGHRETYDLREIAASASQAFGMLLESSEPIAAEHALYMGESPVWRIGHAGGAATAPSTRWYFSEGTTYVDWETFVLLANPNSTPATVTVRYHVEEGPVVTRTYVVPALARLTIRVEDEDAALDYDHFWTEIEADQPIVAERSMYWVKPWTEWTEGHSSPGMTAPRTVWGFAHGRQGLDRSAETWLLLANPNPQPNTVTLRFLTPAGEKTHTVTIPANDRVSYSVSGRVPDVTDTEFWMLLQSSSQLPFLVERSLYWSADGATWTTGTNVTGIDVQPPL